MKTSSAPYRDELFISTKAGHDMWPGPYGEWGSRKTDDPETPLEETLQALVDIAGMGKALYVGISKYPADKAGLAYGYLKKVFRMKLIIQVLALWLSLRLPKAC